MLRPPDIEVVVAHCDEDLAWVRNLPTGVRVAVYHKGRAAAGGTRLPNVGREAHTYLHHIVQRYDGLAEVTVFAQGKPFDHVPDFHKLVRRLAGGERIADGFRWLGFVIDRDDLDGSRLFRTWGKNQDGRGLDMRGFWRRLWGAPAPTGFTFYPGAHFAASAAQFRRRPRAFYRRARELSACFPDAAHCFERCWDQVVGVDGIPPAHRAGPFPVYFRPIRRLGLSWEDVG